MTEITSGGAFKAEQPSASLTRRQGRGEGVQQRSKRAAKQPKKEEEERNFGMKMTLWRLSASREQSAGDEFLYQ